jgi:hypothetical protein
MNLIFGSDPEFFAVYNKNGEEYCVPPVYFHKYLGVNHIIEDKKHPVFIQTKDGVIIHQDGAAFEFGIPVFKSAKECQFYINQGLEELNNLVSKFGFEVYTKPVVKFDPERFYRDQDRDFKECVIFGCDRDWDAFDYQNYNSDVFSVETHPYRYGGGHLHISGDDSLKDLFLPAIQLLALYCGNYFIANTPYPEQEKIRAFHYGKPGKFRPQRYKDGTVGVEYRTPSNSWLSLNENLMEGMLEHAKMALETLHNVEKAKRLMNQFAEITINTIVTSDQEKAKSILAELE